MSEENALPGQEVTLTAMPTVDDVIEAMKDVIDPELMVNVVDLGLVIGYIKYRITHAISSGRE